ncbi:outer arm dynein light chain 2, putative [Perkinsus marinus ATCC 50983]|uniref:Outer arm dynein light chain 2, putative n=1 Tax=Perkinsus marinus (strain ATCC 50983 / TXsc) TaxID=423536 RepID=C5LFS0_PERM5|nr:outer arm dynein light chain 2, putative [Perkinsus marinus ATCC 50983]EER04425.1 outer arm dynein light chain 2, putative [Perkinsus marinus ATCC 50983]|eukprot:XP_002772609.1 outer arm dynein light chain 2, putative [Perkinsus marinus ATCC 50983]
MTCIKVLDVSSNQLDSLEGISAMGTLRCLELHLSNNRLRHLCGLGPLPSLLVLIVDHNRLTLASRRRYDADALTTTDDDKMHERFPSLQLRELVLDQTKLRRIGSNDGSKYRDAKSLQNALNDMKAEREMDALRRARGFLPQLMGMPVSGSPLSSLRRLSQMTLSDLSTNLRELHLENNSLHDLAFVRHLPKLTGLFAASNRISDITEVERLALNGLPRLRRLDLSANPVCRTPLYRLTVIQALPTLRSLDHIVVTLEERQKVDSLAVTRVINRFGSFAMIDEATSMPVNASTPAGLSVKTLGFDNGNYY